MPVMKCSLGGRSLAPCFENIRPCNRLAKGRRCFSVRADAKQKKPIENPNPGMGLKAVWLGAEQFGNVIGLTKPKEPASRKSGTDQVTLSRQEAIAAIKRDYDSNYFVSGRGDMSAYDSSCLFADPFAGFNGVERFQNNVRNLGGLMEDIKLDILDWKESEKELQTKWRFSAVLSLPWRPRLAASGGTTHVFSPETGRVVKHIESWDVEPGAVVKSLLKPSARIPSNNWETLFQALHSGDAKGVWFAAAGPLLVYFALPVVGLSVVVKAATGEGLPGFFLGGIEGTAYLIAFIAGMTQLYKIAKLET